MPEKKMSVKHYLRTATYLTRRTLPLSIGDCPQVCTVLVEDFRAEITHDHLTGPMTLPTIPVMCLLWPFLLQIIILEHSMNYIWVTIPTTLLKCNTWHFVNTRNGKSSKK